MNDLGPLGRVVVIVNAYVKIFTENPNNSLDPDMTQRFVQY